MGTDYVWFYEVEADGRSLDDKRQELLPEEKLGAVPKLALTPEEHAKNNLPDVLARWVRLRSPNADSRSLSVAEGSVAEGSETERPRTAQSFCVPKAEIVGNGYDLSLNRYKEVVHKEVDHVPPEKILATLDELETRIQQGMKELREMLG